MRAVRVDELKPGMISNQTICDIKGLVLIAKGVRLTAAIINRLQNFYVARVMVQDEECDEPDLPESALSDPLFNESPLAKKILTSTDLLVEVLYEDYRINGIKQNTPRIEQVVYSLLEKPFLQRILNEDNQSDALYNHCLRTALISVHMGLIEKYDWLNLEYLALSALLHDTGMMQDFIPEDDDHALLGFVKLRDNDDVDMLIALSCLQHHEWYNGTGVPFAFHKGQLTKFARMIAIADQYDRLLMKKNTPRDAVVEIMSYRGTRFDPSMTDLLEKTIDWLRPHY